MENAGKLVGSFPGNLGLERILAIKRKLLPFVSENMAGIVDNLTPFPGNEHFFPAMPAAAKTSPRQKHTRGGGHMPSQSRQK